LRGRGDYHESLSEASKERIYDLLWRTGYGYGGLAFMKIVKGTGLSERTVRKQLRRLIADGKVSSRRGGHRIGDVIYPSPTVDRVPVALDGYTLSVPAAKLERSRWERAKRERMTHGRGSLSRSVYRIMRGTDLPERLSRPYYVTTSRVIPRRKGKEEDSDF
jgi:DNA-binding transcriptional ArsR family regulator